MGEIVVTRGLCHAYQHGSGIIQVLKDIDLSIAEGDFLAIMGASGSGKSTLLHILGCLLQPTQGSFLLQGREIVGMPERELAILRSETVSHIFQAFHLLGFLSVLENVQLPFTYNSYPWEKSRAKALHAIEQVGLGHRISHHPHQLSGGEMQRVAIARALAVSPQLILADEPTGNLDAVSSAEIMNLFQEIHAEGRTIVLVTHDPEVAALAARTLHLTDGFLQ